MSALSQPFLLANFIAKAKKHFTIGEGLTLPAANFKWLWILGEAAIPKVPYIPLLPRTIIAAKSLQSCPTPCDSTDSSPPGPPVAGILQARTLKRVAISISNAWKWKVKVTLLSPVWLLETPCTAAHQAPPSMGFSRQEYWSGVPLPSPFLELLKLMVSH